MTGTINAVGVIPFYFKQSPFLRQTKTKGSHPFVQKDKILTCGKE